MSRKHTKKRTRENDSLLSASNKRYKPQIPVIDLTKDEDEQPTTTSKKGKNVEQDVECSICYEEIKERGYLDCCDHMFCFPCIYKWSSSSNTCPICKRRFKSIVKEKSQKDGKTTKKKKIHVPYRNFTLDEDDGFQGTGVIDFIHEMVHDALRMVEHRYGMPRGLSLLNFEPQLDDEEEEEPIEISSDEDDDSEEDDILKDLEEFQNDMLQSMMNHVETHNNLFYQMMRTLDSLPPFMQPSFVLPPMMNTIQRPVIRDYQTNRRVEQRRVPESRPSTVQPVMNNNRVGTSRTHGNRQTFTATNNNLLFNRRIPPISTITTGQSSLPDLINLFDDQPPMFPPVQLDRIDNDDLSHDPNGTRTQLRIQDVINNQLNRDNRRAKQ